MESFYLITPIALILIAVAIKLFLWAVNDGQFDDLDREASRILFDDDGVSPSSLEKTQQHTDSNTAHADENTTTPSPHDNGNA